MSDTFAVKLAAEAREPDGTSRSRAMGLDVYVGTLTRYYGGEWSTIIQQMAAATGTEGSVLRPGELPGGEPDRARTAEATPSKPPPPEIWLDRIERWLNRLSAWGGGASRTRSGDPSAQSRSIAEDVARWQAYLNEEQAGSLSRPLEWDESEAAPYFTDKPAWVGYASLLLLAAHDEHPELPRPTRATDDWSDDPAWKLISRDDFATSRYTHIASPSIWLPCDFDRVFSADDVAGDDEVLIGSSVALLAELRALNDRTYQGSAQDLAEWLEAGPEPDHAVDLAASSGTIAVQLTRQPTTPSPFDACARFGLALFLDLAARSVAHRLPMKLDW
jgi:hypothetical protein